MAAKGEGKREAELIAYVLHDCGWKEVPKLQQFQLLPADARPLGKWRDKNEYWRTIADGIEATLKRLQSRIGPEPRRGIAAGLFRR